MRMHKRESGDPLIDGNSGAVPAAVSHFRFIALQPLSVGLRMGRQRWNRQARKPANWNIL